MARCPLHENRQPPPNSEVGAVPLPSPLQRSFAFLYGVDYLVQDKHRELAQLDVDGMNDAVIGIVKK